ncbi:MAG: FAD-binding dehydrogenase [Myxococcales bacterium]|nr:FAD-binding dehydrogenase [Myxococcales bacterium]
MTTKYESDVLIIGGGLTGITAALELLDAGKRVTLLDRATEDRFGGLAKRSFGGLFFVDSPEQQGSGIADSVELAWSDWRRYGELDEADVWPYRWAEAYVHRCLPDVRGWMVERGVSFFRAVNWTERGYYVPGNTVPRFHITWGTGVGVVDPLIERLHGHPNRGRLTLRFGHKVEDLDREGGAVVGAHGTTTSGEPFEARAEATLIASGGIAGNHDKVREVWPRDELGEPPEPMLNGSILEADGLLIDRAAALGASVTHLPRMWNYAAGVRHMRPKFDNHGLSLVPGKSALWMDYRGRRFTDPPLVGSYDTLFLVDRICRQEKKYSWQVLNWKIACKELAVSGAEFNPDVRDKKLVAFAARLLLGNERLVKDFAEGCPDFVTAQTVRELAAKMNAVAGSNDVDAAGLERDIAEYDANVARPKKLQNDDQLRRIAHVRQYLGDRLRTCHNARIVDDKAMPLIAIRTQILTRKSLGGIAADLEGRALDATGEPIAGLFAAGEASGFGGGGMHGKRALEGTFLGGCVFSARMAARGILHGRGADRS